MRKLMILFMAVAAAVVFSSCASVEVTKPSDLKDEKISYSGAPAAHLSASNWGLYFFCFPIFTGSVEEPGAIVVFKDTVNVQSVLTMTLAKSKELKATQTLNIVSRHTTMPFFFGIHRVAISANAVK